MRLYNTLSRSLEEFRPLAPPAVGMYVCGPTVYDIPHLGHARSAYTFDVLCRYLEFSGHKVTFVRNVTDVDDKIIEKAREESAHSTPRPDLRYRRGGQHTAHSKERMPDLNDACRQVAEKYLKSYHETLERLGIRHPTIEPKATEHVVPDMTDFISKLLIQGVAYEAKGDVYFAVRKFPGYGKLSNRSLDELQAGARVEPGEGKQDPMDFALWKSSKPGEPSWMSPWGKGRPGWHIECSLMSTKYLGDTFDIHGGGVDLVFPHHENEIAQSQALGKPFAKYWVHNGLLTVNGEKMSKSLKNYTTVEEALAACGNEPDVLKVFFLGSHYRSPADYTLKNLKTAESRHKGLLHYLRRTDELRGHITPSSSWDDMRKLEDEFKSAMDDDLNTPVALATLDKFVNLGTRMGIVSFLFKNWDDTKTVQAAQGKVLAIADAVLKLGKTLGLFLSYEPIKLNDELRKLLIERETARKQKDFQKSDELRVLANKNGFLIEDTPSGPVVIPKR